MKNRLQAFTLIELLVVIVIIGILSGIGISTYNTYIEKARMAKAQSFAVQVERQLLAENVTSENDFIRWYNFQNESDISQTAPYIKDNSPSKIHMFDKYSSGSFEPSDDTPLGTGWSLRIRDQIQLRQSSDITNNQAITLAGWFKVITHSTSVWDPFLFGVVGSDNTTGLLMKNDDNLRFYTNKDLGDLVTTPTEQSKWHYVVGTVKNGQMKLWLDGELATERSVDPNNSFSVNSIRLGGSATAGYEILLDDIIITSIPFDGFE